MKREMADARGVVVEKSAFGLQLVWDFSFLTDLVTRLSRGVIHRMTWTKGSILL